MSRQTLTWLGIIYTLVMYRFPLPYRDIIMSRRHWLRSAEVYINELIVVSRLNDLRFVRCNEGHRGPR